MSQLKLKLSLYVVYDTNGVSKEQLTDYLYELAEMAMNRGLLTYDSPAEVDECTHEVTEW